MNAKNTGRNVKQQELVKRLEEIRKKRQQDAEPASRHQMETETPRRAKRNKGTQRSPVQPKRKRNEQKPQPKNERQAQLEQYQSYQEELKQQSSPKRAPKKKTLKKRQKKSTLIEQLSDGNKLADAMILNEVLSKPIALRKNNR